MVVEQRAERTAIWARSSFACTGVNWGYERAVEILKEHGVLYILNPNGNGLVHYSPVNEELKEKGAIYISDPRDIPLYSPVANSMHGLSPLDLSILIERRVLHYDLRCNLVTNVSTRVRMAIREAERIGKIAKILYACNDTLHPEPKAIIELAPSHIVPVTSRQILEEYPVDPEREMYFAESQTTINVQEALAQISEYKSRFGRMQSYMRRLGICFATDNRQKALNALIEEGVDRLVVIGDEASSNTQELVKIGESHDIPVEFRLKSSDLSARMFEGDRRVGLTGGASVPIKVGHEVMGMFTDWGFKTDELWVGPPEPETFKLLPPVYDYRSGEISPEVLELTRTY